VLYREHRIRAGDGADTRPGSSVGTSVRLKIGRSAVRPRPWPLCLLDETAGQGRYGGPSPYPRQVPPVTAPDRGSPIPIARRSHAARSASTRGNRQRRSRIRTKSFRCPSRLPSTHRLRERARAGGRHDLDGRNDTAQCWRLPVRVCSARLGGWRAGWTALSPPPDRRPASSWSAIPESERPRQRHRHVAAAPSRPLAQPPAPVSSPGPARPQARRSPASGPRSGPLDP
jgi:hypothetical protein